jgi:hypothetical protein
MQYRPAVINGFLTQTGVSLEPDRHEMLSVAFLFCSYCPVYWLVHNGSR